MPNNLMCKVISLNVRGIRDQAKRRSIFSKGKHLLSEGNLLRTKERNNLAKTNGVVKCISPMGVDTAKVLAQWKFLN